MSTIRWHPPPMRLAWYIAMSALSTSSSEISSPGPANAMPTLADSVIGSSVPASTNGSARTWPIRLARTSTSVAAVQVLAQEDELVAGEPGERVARADQSREPVRDRYQQLIADLMAVDVVDLLEPVEVDEQNRRGRAHTFGALGDVVDSFLQEQPVREPCQGVVQGAVMGAIGRGRSREFAEHDRQLVLVDHHHLSACDAARVVSTDSVRAMYRRIAPCVAF